MNCYVTGVDTNSKWKDIPLSTAARFSAKEVQKMRPHYSFWQCIQELREDVLKYLKEEADKQKQEQMLNEAGVITGKPKLVLVEDKPRPKLHLIE